MRRPLPALVALVVPLVLGSVACSTAHPPVDAEPATSASTASKPEASVGTQPTPADSATTQASISAPPPKPEDVETQEHTLDATIEAIEPLEAGQATVWPVDTDPRFLVTLKVHGVAPQMADSPKGTSVAAGEKISFAVHSPARTFEDPSPAGKRMQVMVTRERSSTGVRYSGLRIAK